LVAQQPETESDFVGDGQVKTEEDMKRLDDKLGSKDYRRQMVREHTVTFMFWHTFALKFQTSVHH